MPRHDDDTIRYSSDTRCARVSQISRSEFDWWSKTDFHVPGYDYLHEGHELSTTRRSNLRKTSTRRSRIKALEQAPHRRGRSATLALVYRNPLAQAASYFRYCHEACEADVQHVQGSAVRRYARSRLPVRAALYPPTQAVHLLQAMAVRDPGLVRLVPYEHLMAKPEEVLAEPPRSPLGDVWQRLGKPSPAVHLARREHLKAVEAELGRSLDGTRDWSTAAKCVRVALKEGAWCARSRDEEIGQSASPCASTSI